MNNNKMAQYISELRIRANYSQTELAGLIGVTPHYINHLESGTKCNPSVKIMAALFKELQMSKSEIEKFLDLHAKANNCVSYDIADFIMENDDVRMAIRNERDKPEASPNWDDFINKINK